VRFPGVRELFAIRLPTLQSDGSVRRQPIPVTLTFQRQVAGACTSISWLPVVFNGVTELPAAAVLVTAGLVPGVPPDANAKI